MKLRRILIMALSLIMALAMLAGCSGGDGKKYIVLEENFGEESFSVGMRLGDNALTLKFQEIMDAMIADGKADEIAQKWFGENVVLKGVDFPRAIDAAAADDTSLQYILDKGTLILGLDENFPPMGYRDESGEIVGFDIDLAKEVATRLGVELVIQPIDWAAKEMELQNKNIDVIWNGMSVTEERTANMNLSKPYLANRQIIIVPEGSDIKTKADLAGKKVAIQAGSSALDAVNADAATAAIIGELVEFADNNSAFLDLKAGRVDAFVVDETYGRYLIANND